VGQSSYRKAERRSEVDDLLARKICRDLGIPEP
jgi:hypothetical protein